MPSVTSATAIRIECINPCCKSEVVYPLVNDKPVPSECPVCRNAWGDGIQAFREALRAQQDARKRGQTYRLHLEFGAEPFDPMVPNGH